MRLNLSKDRNLELIDIYSATKGHREYFGKDNVHPNNAGAELIANEVYKVIK